jgi:hypothetical protein
MRAGRGAGRERRVALIGHLDTQPLHFDVDPQ